MGENGGNGRNPFQVKEEHETPRDKSSTPSINLLDVSQKPNERATTPGSDNHRAGADRVTDRTQPAGDKNAKIDLSPLQELQTTVQGLQQKKLALQQLNQEYFKVDDKGNVTKKSEYLLDPQGKPLLDQATQKPIPVEAYQSQLMMEILKDYEHVVKVSERGANQPIDAVAMTAKTAYENQLNQNKSIEQQLSQRGINVKDEQGQLTSASVQKYLDTHANLPAADRDKIGDLAKGVATQTGLEQTLHGYQLLRNGPIVAHNEYADFLSKTGFPTQAAEHLKKADGWLDNSSRPKEMERVAAQIKAEQEKQVSVSIEKYMKGADNPFEDVARAHKLAAEGKHAEARKALETASEKASRLPKEEIEADLIKMAKSNEQEKQKMAADLKALESTGKLTIIDVAKAAEREAQLDRDLGTMQSLAMAKSKVDMAQASYLLNADPEKNSEANRAKALDLLVKVRFDAVGKAAAAEEIEQFNKDLDKAMNGPKDNQAKLLAYQQAMAKYDELKRQAPNEKDNDKIAAKMQEAKHQAEVAKGLAEGIDRGMADRTQQAIRKEMQSKLADEQKKPAAERDEGKIKLLQEITKPASQQDKNVQALLGEAFREPPNQAKIDELKKMVKNPQDLADILDAHSQMTRMEFMKQSVNQARVAVIEIDCAFDKGENHKYTAEIENDPYGAEFKQSLGVGADGKPVWDTVKEATRDLAWYETAWKWCKGAVKDIAIAVASGVSGFVVGTLVGGMTCWSGPGAVIAGGAAGFATGAAVGTALHALCGDEISVTGVLMNGVDGMSGGLMGAGRSVALRGGALALEAATGRAVASEGVKLTAAETFTALKAAGMVDKVRIVAGTRFGANMAGATLSSIGYRFGHEGINYHAGKYQSFGDYMSSAGQKVVGDIPGNIIGAGIGAGIDKFAAWKAGVPMRAPSQFSFVDYMAAGSFSTQLGGQGYYRPPFVMEKPPAPKTGDKK